MRKLAILFSVILTVIFFASCHRETVEKTADNSQNPNLTVTHTIAQLLEFHPITYEFTYDSLPPGIVIQGIVISSDEEGNCYHYLTIDDGTAGIQIKINKSRLYQDYPVGQHIYVKCDGLVLGDYGMLYQLGWWDYNRMVGIEPNVLNKYIFKDNIYGHIPDPIEITSASQIQDYMYNRLVKVKNCHFRYPDVMFADGNGYATSNDIIFSDGSSIVLYTLASADFASVLTPQDTFDMVALLSRFRNTNQLILRFLNDMNNFIAPGYKLMVSEMNLSINPLDNGWINKTISGSSWEYIQGAAMRIIGDTGDNDSWLISPAIDATTYDNLSISFTHRSLNGTTHRQVYYSTTYTGDNINESEWHSLNVNNFTTGFTEYTFSLPNELLSSSNVRIAFRYNDDTNSTWLLSSFKIFTTVEFK